MSINKNIYYSFLTQIPTIILSFFTGVFSTRILGPEGSGIYTVFLSDTELFTLLLSFSFNAGIVFFISNKKIATEKLMGLGLAFIIIGSSILLLTLLSSKYFNILGFLFPKNYSSPMHLLYLLLLFINSTGIGFLSAIFQGKSHFNIVNKVSIFNAVLNFLLFSLSFLLKSVYNKSIYVNEVLIISSCITTLNLMVWLYFYFKLIGVKPKFKFNWAIDVKPLFYIVIFAHLAHVINFFNYRLDVYVVDHYCGQAELGFYAKAVNVAQMLWLISNPISNVLFPFLNDPDRPDQTKTFTFFSRLNFTTVFSGCILLFFIAPYFFPFLFGEAFSSSVLAFGLLLPGILASAATKIFGVYASSRNKIHFNIIATSVGLVFTIILDFTLIPLMGIKGAAIASSFSYVFTLLTLFIGLFVFLKLEFKNYFFLTISDFKEIANLIMKRK